MRKDGSMRASCYEGARRVPPNSSDRRCKPGGIHEHPAQGKILPVSTGAAPFPAPPAAGTNQRGKTMAKLTATMRKNGRKAAKKAAKRAAPKVAPKAGRSR